MKREKKEKVKEHEKGKKRGKRRQPRTRTGGKHNDCIFTSPIARSRVSLEVFLRKNMKVIRWARRGRHNLTSGQFLKSVQKSNHTAHAESDTIIRGSGQNIDGSRKDPRNGNKRNGIFFYKVRCKNNRCKKNLL